MTEKSPPVLQLVQLVHYRWALPILAELHRDDGAKFVTLVQRLGVSRDSLSRTLEVLIEQGWVTRNPGYGHPLRPEYLLTPEGMLLGPGALELMKALRPAKLEEVALRKWSLPVLYALGQGAKRFSELLAALPGTTSRALTLALADLEGAGLVRREVRDTRPPRTAYRLNPEGEQLAGKLEGLVGGG
jgi:DNA-binding HxlR family transcriptional regulator